MNESIVEFSSIKEPKAYNHMPTSKTTTKFKEILNPDDNIHFDEPVLEGELSLAFNEPIHDVARHFWRLFVQFEVSAVVVESPC